MPKMETKRTFYGYKADGITEKGEEPKGDATPRVGRKVTSFGGHQVYLDDENNERKSNQ